MDLNSSLEDVGPLPSREEILLEIVSLSPEEQERYLREYDDLIASLSAFGYASLITNSNSPREVIPPHPGGANASLSSSHGFPPLENVSSRLPPTNTSAVAETKTSTMILHTSLGESEQKLNRSSSQAVSHGSTDVSVSRNSDEDDDDELSFTNLTLPSREELELEIASLSSAEKEMYRAEYDRLEQELLQSRSGNRLDSSASEHDSRASSFFESDSLKIDTENHSAANSSISSPQHPPNESLSAALPPFDSLLEEISSLSPAEQVYYVDQYCQLALQFRAPVPEEAQRYLRDRSGSSRSSPVHNEIHPYLSSVKAEESVESKGESRTVEYIHHSSDHRVAISPSTGLVECPVSEMERQSKFETQMERLHEEARQYLKESYQTEIDHLRSELAAVRKEKEITEKNFESDIEVFRNQIYHAEVQNSSFEQELRMLQDAHTQSLVQVADLKRSLERAESRRPTSTNDASIQCSVSSMDPEYSRLESAYEESLVQVADLKRSLERAESRRPTSTNDASIQCFLEERRLLQLTCDRSCSPMSCSLISEDACYQGNKVMSDSTSRYDEIELCTTDQLPVFAHKPSISKDPAPGDDNINNRIRTKEETFFPPHVVDHLDSPSHQSMQIVSDNPGYTLPNTSVAELPQISISSARVLSSRSARTRLHELSSTSTSSINIGSTTSPLSSYDRNLRRYRKHRSHGLKKPSDTYHSRSTVPPSSPHSTLVLPVVPSSAADENEWLNIVSRHSVDNSDLDSLSQIHSHELRAKTLDPGSLSPSRDRISSSLEYGRKNANYIFSEPLEAKRFSLDIPVDSHSDRSPESLQQAFIEEMSSSRFSPSSRHLRCAPSSVDVGISRPSSYIGSYTDFGARYRIGSPSPPHSYGDSSSGNQSPSLKHSSELLNRTSLALLKTMTSVYLRHSLRETKSAHANVDPSHEQSGERVESHSSQSRKSKMKRPKNFPVRPSLLSNLALRGIPGVPSNTPNIANRLKKSAWTLTQGQNVPPSLGSSQSQRHEVRSFRSGRFMKSTSSRKVRKPREYVASVALESP